MNNMRYISLKIKVIALYVLVSIIFGMGLYYSLSQFAKKIDEETYKQIQNNLKSLTLERVQVEKDFGLSNAISIVNNRDIVEALKTGNRELAIEVLSRITKKLDVNIHMHTKENISFVREWKPNKYGDDLSSFRKTVVAINKNHKNINSFEVGRIGLVLRSIVSVEDYDNNNTHLGSLELIHHINTIANKFSKSGDGFLLLMDENLSVNEFKKAEKLFHYNISQSSIQKDFLEDAKNIDIKRLFKENFFIGKKYYFTYEEVLDFENKHLGIYLVGRKLSIVQTALDAKKEFVSLLLLVAFVSLFLVILITNIGVNILVLQPLSKIDKGLQSFFDYLQKKRKNIAHIEITTADEFGKISASINENIEVSRKLHEEIAELNLNLEYKIQERTQELESQKETFFAIYNGSKDAIAILDMKSNFLQVNPAYSEITGFSEEELLKTSCLALTLEKDIVPSKNAMAEVLELGFIKNFEKECQINHNKTITINMSMSLLRNPQRVLISVRDVSKRKENEQMLQLAKYKAEENTKLKSEFLANMSHEIRTPMNGIIGLSHIVLKTDLNEKQKEYIEKIDTSANLLLGIINDILDFSKIEAGKLNIEKIDFDMKKLLDTSLSLVSSRAKEKGLKLHIEYPQDLPHYFHADSLRIGQIVTNLLGNAVKFTDDGEVSLHVSKISANRFKFEVNDTGVGLNKEEQNRLFKPFSQTDGSTTRKYGGTGLGLSISKQLVELMGGTIYLESQKGVGSSFIFELDLTEVEKLEVIDEDMSIEEKLFVLKGKNILLVEDNKTNQIVVLGILEDSKLEIDIANNGKEAVEKFKNKKYDLILMDLQMPIMDGYEATKEIRAINKLVPIIALSANAMVEDKERCKLIGMNDHLNKPINVNKLCSTLLTYLEK